MSRTPSKSQSLAMRAAAAIAAQDDDDDLPEVASAEVERAQAPVEEPVKADPPSPASAPADPVPAGPAKRGRGRPKSKRAVEARHTVYLDAARHSALTRLAEDRGRSAHSLILEGIDHVIGKPQSPGWQGR